jgi:hypothetical protein
MAAHDLEADLLDRSPVRKECAMTGRSRAFPRTRQFDPKATFKIGPLNGRYARESGRRLKA